MGNNGIASVYNAGIITPLVEHTHIKSQYVSHINSTSHTAFIRADDHHMIGIKLKVRYML